MMRVCFVNLPLVTKSSLTTAERRYYANYWSRMANILGSHIREARFSSRMSTKDTLTPAYDIQELPLWISALASSLDTGFDIQVVDMFDLSSPSISSSSLSRKLAATSADLYLMSPMLLNHEVALTAASVIHHLHGPDVRVLIGGPFATYCPDVILSSADVDVVYRGRISNAFSSLLCDVVLGNDLSDYNGVSWHRKEQIIHNPPVTDCSLIQHRFEILPNFYRGKLPWLRIYCSEGCPWACAYCADVIWNHRKPRYRQVNEVILEAANLARRFDVDTFYVGDETFTFDQSFVTRFSEGMASEGLSWFCQTRIDQVNPTLLHAMKQGNCRMVKFGAESASQTLLDKIRKGIHVKEIEPACAMVKDADMAAFTYWLVGLPGETEATALQTMNMVDDLLTRNVIDLLEWFICVPYPGTDLYQNPKRYGIEIDWKPWRDWREDAPSVISTHALTAERIYEIWNTGLERFASKLGAGVA